MAGVRSTESGAEHLAVHGARDGVLDEMETSLVSKGKLKTENDIDRQENERGHKKQV